MPNKIKYHTAIYGLAALLSLSINSCQDSASTDQNAAKQELQIQGSAQGTTYTVKYLGEKMDFLPPRIDSLLASVDHSLSTYDTSSLITAFNNGDTIIADELFRDMVNYSKLINRETNGAFDPTIGPLIKAWGWDFSQAEKMDSLKVDSLLALKGFDNIYLSTEKVYLKEKNARLNFNAIAQGYSVDLMAKLLEDLGIENYYVELGGEVKVKGKNANEQFWRIGIDRPEGQNNQRKLIAVVNLENKAMATSGNYRKYYEKDGRKYSHTIDPSSGFPVEHNLLSATVISNNCYRADALATAFMVMGLEKSKDFLKENSNDLALLIYSKEDGGLDFYTSPELEKKIEKIEEED